ncbi:MAG TPA: carboxypeptidase-like regulatory domain-containing protein, partial [Prolixibacteraceae bacterium]|nr:carboxypeptidase-like regulatory domain-containing protein [Prolixibacteraceae bacterium]
MKNSINFNRSSVTGALFNKARLMLLVVLMLATGGAISSASAQGNTYSGKVLDAEGSPLIGVNVMVEGTTVGTVTDVDGNFSLSYSADGATLIVSFIGYKTKEVEAGAGDNLTITLEEDLMGIDQVVVVGYGVQKKSLVTGAISSVKSEDMENSSNARVEQALQGRTAGVTVLPTSGSPGAGSKIRIRGVSSNSNSDPLYIVDGMKTGSIDNIAPNDIESIEILKDAASAAIYGTEGANGVILISTKGGSKGESKISYNFQAGIQSSRTKMKLMNAEQYVGYLDEADIQTIDSYDYDTDWMDEVFENAPMQKHHISFSGGNDKST